MRTKSYKGNVMTYNDKYLVYDFFDFSGLIAYYPFDTDGSDLSGNGNDAVQTGGTYSAGKFDNAFDTDGTGRLDVADSTSLSFTTELTIVMWLKFNWASQTTNQYTGILAKGGEFEIYYYKEATTFNFFEIRVNGASPGEYYYARFNCFTGATQFNNFRMMTFLVDLSQPNPADRFEIYLDDFACGNPGSLGTASASFNNTNDGLKIGTTDTTGSFDTIPQGNNYIGLIDDLSIWNRRLKDEEILSIYNKNAPLL